MKRIAILGIGLFQLGLLIALANPASATQQKEVVIWHWNMAGWKLHDGRTGDITNHVVGSSMKRDATFISLNEVCRNQYAAISKELKARGWPTTGSSFNRFAKIRQNDKCNGEEFGMAMFYKEGFGNTSRHSLPSSVFPKPEFDPGDGHVLMCAPSAAQTSLRLCTVHIIVQGKADSSGSMLNVQQLNETRNVVEQYEATGNTVVLAGDFNAQPHYARVNNWYSPDVDTANNSGNTGYYRELDDNDSVCLGYGEMTARTSTGYDCGQGAQKIDMIFVRENRIIGEYSADALGVAHENCVPGSICSDHRILTGRVTVNLN